jgi:hypothetical protein
MTLLNTINVGGTDFGLLNNTVMGVCDTPAGSEVKACTFADSFELTAGVVVTIKFTYANTYGDGNTTYPKLSVGGTSYPIKYATNAYAGAGAWINGQTVPFMFDGTGFILVANLMQTSVISSANTTVNGAPLYNGANVKVMFTSALSGADASTALTLTYNGSNITVKVPVNGALADYTAKAVDESGTTAYYYCQAYTTFELLFDGTNFVITNNPVVYSNSDCEIKSDGSITYTKTREDALLVLKPEIYSADITVTTDAQGIAEITRGNLPIGFYNCPYVVTFFNGTVSGFIYFMQVKDYNGNPVANQEVSMRLIFIPNILGITQHQN